MHTILTEGLQDEEYIRDFTDDFDAMREVVMRYSPEDAEKVTGVAAEDIRATAREYATERHAAIFYTLGITEHACGVDNIWSLSNLVLMTGHLGYESTGLNALRGQNNVQGLNDSGANPNYLPGYQPVDDPEIRRKFSEAWGAEVPETPGYRLDQMMSGLHDGRVRALYLVGENPAQTEPNAHHVDQGLAKLDFMVSQDIFLNDMTQKYADVVLPASSFAEKDGTFTNTERRVSRVRKAAPLPGDAKEDREIILLLSRALGVHWPEYPDAESVWNELADLAPAWYGVRYDRLEENGIQWPAPELGHPGTPFLHAPAPARPPGRGKFFPVEYQRPIEEPDSEYPLVLSTGRTLYHYNSATMTMREAGITDKQEEPFFEISSEDASALGIAEGDWARLVSRRGDLQARAHITDRVFPGLVWMALHFAEQKVNWLTHDVGDPLIGTPEYKVSAVRVEPASTLQQTVAMSR
jgi:formate dehydrogenase major subunit/formate dehydrogenase alpha subunit